MHTYKQYYLLFVTRNQKSQYQRHLTPVGVRTIIKEERCYLPDGPIYELRDIWTADSTTEE
jgi:hypothetical protein